MGKKRERTLQHAQYNETRQREFLTDSFSSHPLPDPKLRKLHLQNINFRARKSSESDMGDESKQDENMVDGEEEEEHVLLDLDDVCDHVSIPPGAPYVLSGLDTENPVLVIGDHLKLIGEYEETIGTCYVFTETETAPLAHEETGPSDANLFKGKCIVDPTQASEKQVKPTAGLHKILKFRLLSEVATQEASAKFK